jgi:hypothetical protein
MRSMKLTSQQGTDRAGRSGQSIGAFAMGFALLGGTAAWGVHIFFAWSLLELACLRGDVGPLVRSTAALLTAVPLLAAAVSLGASVKLRSRRRRVQLDALAQERVDLLTHLAVFLNVLAVTGIAGGGIALLVLEPCG